MLKQSDFIQQLGELVKFNNLSRDAETNRQALDYVEKLLSPQAKVQRLTNDGSEMLLASNIETQEPDFGYMVHIDIVAGGDDLFVMRQEGDKLLGRGVSDMKFSIPMGVAILNELIETKSPISFCLAITTDEEIGGFAGGAFLAGEFGWRPKVLIVPDGGDNFRFVEKAKGVCSLAVTAKGVATHASRPWEGKNALPSLCRLVVKLEELFGQNNLKANWNTTLNFGQLHGGISTNQVCDEAVLKLDFRYPETDSIAKIEALVRKLANEIDPSLTIERLSTGLPTFVDVKLPVVKKFIASMEAESERKMEIQATYGASDARHFAQFQTPVLMAKPMGGDIHAITEWLSLTSAMEYYQGLRRFLQLKK